MDVEAIMNTTRNQMIDFLVEDLVISGRSQVIIFFFNIITLALMKLYN